MEEVTILLIILSIAFLFENKPINLIFNFVGILITLSLLIYYYYSSAIYFSFILIIVYTSALSILFGFIIMLNPNNYNLEEKKTGVNFIKGIIITLLLSSIIVIISKTGNYVLNYHFNDFINFIINTIKKNNNNIETLYLNKYKEVEILYKIGDTLYTFPSVLLKFFISVLILLISILSLFYLLSPTL